VYLKMIVLSSGADGFLERVFRKSTKSVVKAIAEDGLNGQSKIPKAFLFGFPLAVCSRDFRTPCNVPVHVAFENSMKTVLHDESPS